ncbi:MAG: HDIG domain-containing protein [Kofleriaceae bacterium]|nr:HDIG domain-containing protein [Kofleriaceae bacterium]MBP6839694.1 HDIG domain-containing protein [Kofleriaceae bacterium]MBP9207304.1 HDIG domain-containing protein [Kofleriaceae bacterium]
MFIAVLAGLVATIAAALVVRGQARRAATAAQAAARARAQREAAAEAEATRLAALAEHQAAMTAVRQDVVAARREQQQRLVDTGRRLDGRAEKVAAAERNLARRVGELEARAEAIDTEHRELDGRRDRSAGLDDDTRRRLAEAMSQLEARAGASRASLVDALGRAWLDDARAAAAARVRAMADPSAGSDPAVDRQARRLLEISAARYQNHFLTERNASFLRLGGQVVSLITGEEGRLHRAIEAAAGVALLVSDDGEAIRLDGLDGVGKEVARRAIGKLVKRPDTVAEARADAEAWALRFRSTLEQEIRALGKKAFSVLGVSKAHPEIVELVGALNYRTSYTQNQWLHAVESSFLCGMMAAELGLDEKLARRATLMHDIGKALTHKIEGSHAVIGADIARRLGEAEVVANAIGSHHADEPPSSAYAYLVAAADAMSGARPGARREQDSGFSTKVEDLERIGRSRRGVDRAHAVHGGRELRVYVREREVDDHGVIELSTDIAAQIAEEMTFPGQIKVTVIRAFEAVSTAS